MKRKILLLSVFIITGLQVQSQSILNITMSPAAPDDNDTITFYVDLEFPYMGCAGYATSGITGNTIAASALHCMGMLAAICNDVDTVIVSPRPAGNYNFYFTLSGGYGGPPCSPPLQPNDSDSLSFTVSSTAGIEDHQLNELSIFPNPSSGKVNIDLPVERFMGNIAYQLHNAAGSLVLNGSTSAGKLELLLEPGAYLFSIPASGIHQRIVIVR